MDHGASMTANANGVEEAESRFRGSLKGQRVRDQILAAALIAFGKYGFAAATTREIAIAAGVTLPALKYYFGGKEALYRACAEAVVDEYRGRMAVAASAAREALARSCDAQEARRHLLAVMTALAEFLIGEDRTAKWALFIAREMSDPGAAFEILMDQLWRPGVSMTAALVSRACRRTAGSADSTVDALFLISGLIGFQSGGSVANRMLDARPGGPPLLELVVASLERQIRNFAPPPA
jgi:AcrR family transcriptional regulator